MSVASVRTSDHQILSPCWDVMLKLAYAYQLTIQLAFRVISVIQTGSSGFLDKKLVRIFAQDFGLF